MSKSNTDGEQDRDGATDADADAGLPGTNVEHSVTRANTVKHWVLYTLDAIESDSEPRNPNLPNEAREYGTYPEDVYEYAAGDDSIVFRNKREIQQALSGMARQAEWFNNDQRAVNRRSDATDWDGPDVQYLYRLSQFGRRVLLDLGIPERLPNRQTDGYERELPGAKPGHKPGWWLEVDAADEAEAEAESEPSPKPDPNPASELESADADLDPDPDLDGEYDLYENEWDLSNNEWVASDHERVFFKDGADAFSDRGYDRIGYRLADLDGFEDVTFILTVGPYRMHDMAYAIRDPWRKVVQIDIYSPMALHRTTEEIRVNFERLVHDLRRGLRTAKESYGDGESDNGDSDEEQTN